MIGDDGEVLGVEVFKNATEHDLAELLREWRDYGEDKPFAYIESVHAMPKQGVSSTFKFGQHYGSLLMGLACLEIPYERVAPGVWQRAMGCLTGGEKNISKAKAQQLFPALKITHAIADALLIAEYGRRMRK